MKLNRRLLFLFFLVILIPVLFFSQKSLEQEFSIIEDPLILSTFYQKSTLIIIFNLLITITLIVLGFLAGNIISIRKINKLQSELNEKISLQDINLIEERNRTRKKTGTGAT